MIENVIETTENCRYCLMCRHIAPVGHVTGEEALTPHGIALTIASQRRGLLDWNPETVAVVYGEPDGGNCRAHCVTDQPLPAAVAAVRAEIVAQDLAPAAVYDVHERLQRYGTAFATEAVEAAGGSGKTALFAGDEAVFLRPEALEAARQLMAATGLEPTLTGYARSNGFLANSLGFPETARETAETIINSLEQSGATQLFVLSAGDYFTFSQLYDERLGIPWPGSVELVDLATYLARELDDGRLEFGASDDKRPYAYVDPTHAVRTPFRFAAARSLAEAVLAGPRRELFWRQERAHPVGSTALQFARPDIAEKLTRARLEDARDSGAELIVCEDPATLSHLASLAAEYDLEVLGLYELLAANLK